MMAPDKKFRAEMLTLQKLCSRYPLMNRDEEYALALQTKQKGAEGKRTKQEFINRNLRLVLSFVRLRTGYGNQTPSDIFQDGCIGLQRAVEKFDPTKGFRFSTYASYWIRQSITRSIRTSEIVQTPNGVWDDYNAIQHRGAILPKGRSERALNFRLTAFTLDLVCPVTGEAFKNLMEDESAVSPEDLLEQKDFLNSFKDLPLKERDKQITLRWLEGKSLSVLGEEFNLTKERCRQVVELTIKEAKEIYGE